MTNVFLANNLNKDRRFVDSNARDKQFETTTERSIHVTEWRKAAKVCFIYGVIQICTDEKETKRTMEVK